jgi:hypothetical protein
MMNYINSRDVGREEMKHLPVSQVLKRQELLADYLAGRISPQEWDAFNMEYKTLMQTLWQRACENGTK